MTYLRTVHEQSKVLAALSALVCLVLMASFAACLTCDTSDCCEDADHEEEEVCACGCALHALMLVQYGPSSSSVSGETLTDRTHFVRPAPVYSLFHPPRFAC
jgi:hypothetical protein